MSEFYYHGSHTADITTLRAGSILHGTNQKVLYLTENIPYALFYIWDANHTGSSTQHITGWVQNGTAWYEEQFPDQLKTFYQGVSGYLYAVAKTPKIQLMSNRESIVYSPDDQPVHHTVFIPDVYEALLQYETAGKFQIRRYNEQSKTRQKELINLIAEAITQSAFFLDNPEYAAFLQKYFAESWKQAEARKNSK